jgi:hypothetical protein
MLSVTFIDDVCFLYASPAPQAFPSRTVWSGLGGWAVNKERHAATTGCSGPPLLCRSWLSLINHWNEATQTHRDRRPDLGTPSSMKVGTSRERSACWRTGNR